MKWSEIFIVLNLIFCLTVKAQIGINTENPKYLFHIDPKGDNPSTGIVPTSKMGDDLIVDANGNIGIGIAPSTKLDINGSLFVQGSNLKSEMRLTSDASGNASWQEVKDIVSPIESIMKGVLYGNADGLADPNIEDVTRSLTVPNTTMTNLTKQSIKVTSGIWLIYSSVGAHGYDGRNSLNGGSSFFWIYLKNKTNGAILETVGGLQEDEGGYWSKPHFVKLITFTADAELEIWARADYSMRIMNRYGGTHFGAVKILNI